MYNHQVLLSWTCLKNNHQVQLPSTTILDLHKEQTCVSHLAAAEDFNRGLTKNNYLGLAEYISESVRCGLMLGGMSHLASEQPSPF